MEKSYLVVTFLFAADPLYHDTVQTRVNMYQRDDPFQGVRIMDLFTNMEIYLDEDACDEEGFYYTYRFVILDVTTEQIEDYIWYSKLIGRITTWMMEYHLQS